MANYREWETKAADLCKEVDREERVERETADEALGLGGAPMGPPVAMARAQRQDMVDFSQIREQMIARQAAREVVFEETGTNLEEAVVIGDVDNKAIRFHNCTNMSYVVAEGQALLKVFVTNCSEVKIHIRCRVKTSFMEIDRASDVEIILDHALAMVQCDELTDGRVRIIFEEVENLSSIVHQNCPALEVAVTGQKSKRLGQAGSTQFISKPTAQGEYRTERVKRGEREFPVNIVECTSSSPSLQHESIPEEGQCDEFRRQQAEAKRLAGNSAFKANDFLQAAAYFTEAINLCQDLHLVWANRAQCWLKTGQPDKALIDASKCTELAPGYAKGWFRKGMALHALGLYGKAILAFCEAEKLDTKNPQIPEAIKMAQMMCKKHGSGE